MYDGGSASTHVVTTDAMQVLRVIRSGAGLLPDILRGLDLTGERAEQAEAAEAVQAMLAEFSRLGLVLVRSG
ncbi:MAG: HPr-rel-A system PqqD family peptide chaperone [Burkholderiales bacterium]|nr:HPr-rel-A system PqqD family peptide chaperone [Burkholderiales bacterium]